MRGGTQLWEINGPPRRWRRGLVSKVVMGNRDERGDTSVGNGQSITVDQSGVIAHSGRSQTERCMCTCFCFSLERACLSLGGR